MSRGAFLPKYRTALDAAIASCLHPKRHLRRASESGPLGENDMKPTIESLEGEVWPEPECRSGLVLTAHALRKKPLDDLTPNDLRVAFNEDVGADFLKQRVLTVLQEDPASGDLFEGDLVLSVLRSRQFREDDEFAKNIIQCASAALAHELDSETRHEIKTLTNA